MEINEGTVLFKKEYAVFFSLQFKNKMKLIYNLRNKNIL